MLRSDSLEVVVDKHWNSRLEKFYITCCFDRTGRKRCLLTYSWPRHSLKLKPKGRRAREDKTVRNNIWEAWWGNDSSCRLRAEEEFTSEETGDSLRSARRVQGREKSCRASTRPTDQPTRSFTRKVTRTRQKTCSTAVESSNTWDQSVLLWKMMLTS